MCSLDDYCLYVLQEADYCFHAEKLGIEKEHQNAYSIPLFPARPSTKNMAVFGYETLAAPCCVIAKVMCKSIIIKASAQILVALN